MGHLNKNHRAGFTIIELLTVIAIIALMASLLVGASYRFVVNARESATATTIMKASGIIQDRVRAFQEFNFTDAGIAAMTEWNYANQNSTFHGGAGNNNYSWVNPAGYFNSATPPLDPIISALAEVLVRKVRYKKAFPQAFTELDASQITRFFGSATIPPTSSSYDSKYESGIVLYAVLMKGETFGASTPGDDTFIGAELLNSAATANLPCLVDAWGEPLRFYRWPTRLIRCGEQNYSGQLKSGSYLGWDDYNQDTVQDNALAVPYDTTTSSYGSGGCLDASGNVIYTPAIRPYSPSLSPVKAGITSPTPASLLMSNLPPFERNAPYALGADGVPGSSANPNSTKYIGWPDTDDPEPLNTDPDDPTLKLSLWLFDTNFPPASLPTIQASRQSNFVSDFHDFYTFHTPLIVSAGPDKRLGLYEPSNRTNFGYLAAPMQPPTPPSSFTYATTSSELQYTFAQSSIQYLFDNITNLNQRAGGK